MARSERQKQPRSARRHGPVVRPKNVISLVPLPSWIKAATRCGFSIGPVLLRVGVLIDKSDGLGVTMTTDQARQLVEACVAKTTRDHFPLVLGELFVFDGAPEFEALLSSSTTLREAVIAYNHWVGRLMSPNIQLQLHEAGPLAQVRIVQGKGVSRSAATLHYAEVILASVLRMIRMLMGRKDVDYVTFRRSEPDIAATYRALLRTQVLFGRPYDAIFLKRDLLDVTLDSAVPQVYRQAEERLNSRVAQLSSLGSVSGQLERFLIDDTALLVAGIEASASRLGVHPRTLQRRLREEGQSFAEVHARARRNVAQEMLSNSSYSLEEVSERLGFSDRRVFTRAFTRWTGVSPSAWRKKHHHGRQSV